MLRPSGLCAPHAISRRIAQKTSEQHAPYARDAFLIIEERRIRADPYRAPRRDSLARTDLVFHMHITLLEIEFLYRFPNIVKERPLIK